ncbi:MAG: hypothetical protein H8E38_06815 [SAR324 cluster bacterium]|nr:hypothetical protein [SAR324 cluster bacterium]MBL7035373.1 hypothetical protein [SAR324 cluster bacterium]
MFLLTRKKLISAPVSFAFLLLFIGSATDLWAYKEKEIRSSSKRVKSIIEGKTKLDKSAYSADTVRKSTPTLEQLQPPEPTIQERRTAQKLQNLLISPVNYKKKLYGRKEATRPVVSNKGSYNNPVSEPPAVSKLCDPIIAPAYCTNAFKPKPYFGNTPRKKPRELDLYGTHVYKRHQESKIFVQQLRQQSNR